MSNRDVVRSRWQSINGQPYSTAGDRFNPPGLDCSGAFQYANRTVIPRLGAINTASFAQLFRSKIKPVSKRRPWDALLYDRYGDVFHSGGPRGHIGQVSDDLNVVWEGASRGGIRRYPISGVRWTCAVDLTAYYGIGSAPVPQPPTVNKAAARLLEKSSYNWTLPMSITQNPRAVSVGYLQASLNLTTGSALKVDAQFGLYTTQAVVNLQTLFRLTVDGVVGDQTRDVLTILLHRAATA